MPRTHHHNSLISAIGCISLLAFTTFLPSRARAQPAQVINPAQLTPANVAAQSAAQVQARAKALEAQAKSLDAQAKMLKAQDELKKADLNTETGKKTQTDAEEAAKAAAEAAAEAEKAEKAIAVGAIGTQLVNSRFAINIGVTLLNPYSITNGPGRTNQLQNSGDTESKFFIEAVYNNVWAWDPFLRGRFAKNLANDCCEKQDAWFPYWGSEGLALDFQARLSFYAKDDKETTASAIVGSGSFGSEITVGFPIYRALYTDSSAIGHPGAPGVPAAGKAYDRFIYDQTEAVHWVGVVASYSGVTDSDAFDIHSRYLMGLGYRAATSKLSYVNGREAAISVTVGGALVETLEFLNDGTKEIKVRHGDVPDYRKQAAFAVELEMYFPVSSSLSAVMGSRLYNGLDPNTWNAYVALTVPLDRLASLLK